MNKTSQVCQCQRFLVKHERCSSQQKLWSLIDVGIPHRTNTLLLFFKRLNSQSNFISVELLPSARNHPVYTPISCTWTSNVHIQVTWHFVQIQAYFNLSYVYIKTFSSGGVHQTDSIQLGISTFHSLPNAKLYRDCFCQKTIKNLE